MKIAIIGAGMSGLAAAWYAWSKGWAVDLYEAEEQIGGRIACTRLGDRNLELGGKNIGLRYGHFRALAAALGQDRYEAFGLNSSREIHGRVALLNKDRGPLRTLRQLHHLCGTKGVLQLLPHAASLRQDRQQGFLHSPRFDRLAEHQDQQPLSEHFSPRCVNHFIRTLTVRMNGAEPDECYLGNFGTNLGLVLDRFEQLQDGMAPLLASFLQAASGPERRVFTGQRVTRLEQTQNAQWRVFSQGVQHDRCESYDQVLMTLPAPQAAGLLAESHVPWADTLRRVRYYPVAVAVARYAEPVFTPQHRAMVFETSSPLSNAGAYGVQDLNRVRYTFSGRAARAQVTPDTSGEQALSLGEARLARHFHLQDNPRQEFVYRYLSTGLCAYSAHHGQWLDNLLRLSQQTPGLSLTGDYWRGASLEACCLAAKEAVERIDQGLNSA